MGKVFIKEAIVQFFVVLFDVPLQTLQNGFILFQQRVVEKICGGNCPVLKATLPNFLGKQISPMEMFFLHRFKKNIIKKSIRTT